MGTIPENKTAGEKLNASEANDLRDIGYFVSLLLGENISGATTPVPAYIKVSDGALYACDANDQTELEFVGFVIDTDTTGNAVQLQMHGIVGGFTGLTLGARYYVQDAVGTIGTTPGTYEVYVGIAVSTTQLLIDKGPRAQMQYMGSAAESGGTITSPAGARMAVIHASNNATSGDGSTGSGDIVIFAIGKTTGRWSNRAPSAGTVSCDVSWSGTTITVTYGITGGDSSKGATAYFYR